MRSAESKRLDMLHGPIWSKLPQFALPVAATAILEQLFNASDIAVVGNFTGADKTIAVAAVGANSALIALIVNLFIGIALGATVALVLLTGRFLLSIFNNDPQVIALGYDRLKIVFFAYIFSLLYEVMSGYLRGFGISLVPAALTALGVCGIRIAWIHFAFPQHPTLQTIMTSYPVSLSATALMIFIALLCYRPARKHAAMEREPAPAGK